QESSFLMDLCSSLSTTCRSSGRKIGCYDLDLDIGGKTNLADSRPEIAGGFKGSTMSGGCRKLGPEGTKSWMRFGGRPAKGSGRGTKKPP
ncbi:MAG: hypothetical protein CMO47_05060, partial [Verrucomicrobiales bacterium]|nr:hypothetical protein [Verrucomicrobiales bacterium]